MWFRSFIIGVTFTIILLVLLVSSRLLKNVEPNHDLELREVSVVEMPSPPAPPEMSEPEEDKQQEVEPITASVTLLDPSLDTVELNTVQLKAAPVNLLPALSLDAFHTDLAIASLPTTKPIRQPQPTNASSSQSRPKVKPYYSVSELDAKPRELRKGSFRWPNRARGKKGWVKLKIEIDTEGRARVISVLGQSDPALVVAAKRVAAGSRFSKPTLNGKPVKARYTYTYNLIKPR